VTERAKRHEEDADDDYLTGKKRITVNYKIPLVHTNDD
jgi:hypothetical protein